MTFRVMEDGTILNQNGIKIGIITIDSSKYRDELISNIETIFPNDLINDIIVDYFPNTESSSYDDIDKALEGISLETIKNNYSEIVSMVNYYR